MWHDTLHLFGMHVHVFLSRSAPTSTQCTMFTVHCYHFHVSIDSTYVPCISSTCIEYYLVSFLALSCSKWGNDFTCECFDEDLHTTMKTKNWRIVSVSLLKSQLNAPRWRWTATVLKLLVSKDQVLVVGESSLFCILAFTLLIALEDLTSRVIIFPVRVLMKICIPPWRCKMRWRVDLQML